jgi:hypothetical protein
LHRTRVMRVAFALLPLLAACSDRPLIHSLPQLAAAQGPAGPLEPRDLHLIPGEHLVWSVQLDGVTIGKAELAVGDGTLRSRFHTEGLLASLVTVKHDLVTAVDRAGLHASHATETFVYDGKTKHYDVAFEGAHALAMPGGNSGQTIHTALGAVRSWAAPDAHAAYLYLFDLGTFYRFDVARPIRAQLQGQDALRVVGHICTDDKAAEPIGVTVWLTNTPTRIPLRIEIASNDKHVTADLIDSARE